MRSHSEYGDTSPLTRSRSVSISSDVPAKPMLSSPPPVDPSPAFIAASSASQIVSVDMEQNEVIPNDGEEGCINPNSLSLLNGFLDYLLFSFLASAKSTQLSALRPAIADVLKPRLAKEVVAAADEELGEYMGDGEEDELHEFRGGRAPHGEFDLVRAWKLARLRCMVYTRLGDLEEEEEDEYIAREGLDETGGAPRRFSGHAGNITPAAAIFLTSIIEYLGEHALVIAGENARNRVFSAARLSSKLPNAERTNQKMMVEESDMEKLALNTTLGRLWRTWKKGIRTPTLSRSFSRESFARRSTTPSSKNALASPDEIHGRDSRLEEPVEEEESRPKSVEPANIALPMNDKDIDEIEVPGLWVDIEEVQTMQAAIAQKVRPRSLIVSRSGSLTPTSPNGARTWPATNSPKHHRSQSVPVQVELFKQSDRSPSRETPSLETVTEQEPTEAVVTTEPAFKDEHVTSSSISKEHPEELSGAKSEPLATVQTDSSEDAAQSDQDRRGSGDEVVEGQGTYQRPRLNNLSMQRPKRKQSKDTAKKEGSGTYMVENRTVSADYRDDHQPSMQGGEVGHDVNSAPTQQNATHVDDMSHAQQKIQPISHPIAPTSHPRQLESDRQATLDENINPPRNSSTTSRHASSVYTESIGAPHSTSDDSEGSIYRSIPSRAASHAASIRSQPRQDDQSTGRERATVQRVYVPSTTSQASIKSRRSTSISEKRPLTSGSGTSNVSNKLKVLIGRHPTDTDVPLPAPPRRSSDASRFAASEDVDEAALDELIKSDETIRFTLTPRTMREIEVSANLLRTNRLMTDKEQMPGSPRWNSARNDVHKDRTDTSDLATFFRTTAPPGQPVPSSRFSAEREPPLPRTKPAPPSLAETTRSHSAVDAVSERSSPTSLHSTASPVSRTSSRTKAAMQQAREARVGGDSVRDFAQFIRATGPRADIPPNSHVRDGSDSVMSSSRPDTAHSVSSRITAKPRSSSNSIKKKGPRLQAREPAGHNSSETSDLIDFIREGPPGASTHRIPRTVAPFRNTMDSEDLILIEKARDNDTRVTPSLASTGAESTSSSRAPLLSNSDAPPIPRRKRRGPRDPYAIDVSDDEDEEEFSEPVVASKPPRAEESLLDFLNSVPPPVTQKAPEPFILTSYPIPPKSSGQGMSSVTNRFRRNTVNDKSPTMKKSMPSMRSPKTVAKPQISSPIPQSNGFSTNRSGYSAQLSRERGLASQPSMPSLSRPSRQTETGALADFFKNTAPPQPVSRPPTVMSEDRKDSAFSKFFRRKRLET
ncbi:hypothetical protein EIK77_003880 [Talaromyces pinophilus]|nr:hypothetical protein EIK77_003880 [Talaromyces pinophilus]